MNINFNGDLRTDSEEEEEEEEKEAYNRQVC